MTTTAAEIRRGIVQPKGPEIPAPVDEYAMVIAALTDKINQPLGALVRPVVYVEIANRRVVRRLRANGFVLFRRDPSQNYPDGDMWEVSPANGAQGSDCTDPCGYSPYSCCCCCCGFYIPCWIEDTVYWLRH